MLLDRFQQNLRPLRLHFLLEAVLNLIRNFLYGASCGFLEVFYLTYAPPFRLDPFYGCFQRERE